jgi:hypothetical protein
MEGEGLGWGEVGGCEMSSVLLCNRQFILKHRGDNSNIQQTSKIVADVTRIH